MIRCSSCEQPLVARLTETTLTTVSGETLRFQRNTDHVACPNCGAIHRINALRAEAVARGDLEISEDDPEEPDDLDTLVEQLGDTLGGDDYDEQELSASADEP